MKSTRVRRIVCDVGSETDGVFSAGTTCKAKLSIYLSIYLSICFMYVSHVTGQILVIYSVYPGTPIFTNQ